MKYRYCTFYRNLSKPDGIILRDLESPKSANVIIIKDSEGGNGFYHSWGEFSCLKEVEPSDLEKAVVGEQALKAFEKKYEGNFMIPKMVPLFPKQ
jgi:hypothetical protein